MNSAQIKLLDNHLHLQDRAFENDREAILDMARQNGVALFCSNGTHPNDWDKLEKISRQHKDVIPSFGVHPWFVNDLPENWMEQLRLKLDSIPSGIGEIGLDRWINPRNEDLQEKIFRQQLSLAAKLELPVSIHCLRAWIWLLKIFKEEILPEKMLIHAYGGSHELISPLIEKGCYISFAPSLLRKEKEKLRETFKQVPLERLMLETDSPDIPPPQGMNINKTVFHGKQLRNEPANLLTVLTKAADLLSMPASKLAESLWRNATRFWGDLITPNAK